VPVGVFPASYVLDVLAMITKSDKLAQASYYNMMIGCAGALPAALTGFLDYRQMDQKDPAQKTAVTHGLLNGGLIGLYTLNLLVRRKNKRSFFGFILSTIGTMGLLASGWLGGEIAYGRGWRVRAAERFELEWQKEHKTGPFAEGDHSDKTTEEEFPPEVLKAFYEPKSGQEVFEEIKNSSNGKNASRPPKQAETKHEDKPEPAQFSDEKRKRASSKTQPQVGRPSQAEGERDTADEGAVEATGKTTGKSQNQVGKPSQAEGDRDTIDASLAEHHPPFNPDALG
jgi:uncharacterized membrane protein